MKFEKKLSRDVCKKIAKFSSFVFFSSFCTLVINCEFTKNDINMLSCLQGK